MKEELELRGAPVKVIVHDEVVEDEEPMVCRLTAGGRWIRTIGPRSPVSSVGAACRSCLRGSGSGSALLYPRLEPLRRAGLGYGLSRLWLAALRGGFRHLAVQLIYTFFSSFYRRARCRAAWLFIEFRPTNLSQISWSYTKPFSMGVPSISGSIGSHTNSGPTTSTTQTLR